MVPLTRSAEYGVSVNFGGTPITRLWQRATNEHSHQHPSNAAYQTASGPTSNNGQIPHSIDLT